MSAERVLPEWADWQACQAARKGALGCIGSQLGPGRPCLAHSDKRGRRARLEALRAGGPLDFGQGVDFTEELLAEVLKAAPTEDGQRILHNADLRGASFQGDASFDEASFQGRARFTGASFQGDASFDEASFQGRAQFDEASFQGRAQFHYASFQGRAEFDRASFQGDASFTGASFQGVVLFSWARFHGVAGFAAASFQDEVWFDDASFQGEAIFVMARFHRTARFRVARFQGDARFGRTSFQGDAKFHLARFQGDAWFALASFQGDVRFDRVRFQGNARFDEASFERPLGLGPVLVGGTLSLDRIVFTEPVQVAATAAGLSCRGSRFRAGGQLGIADAEVTLEDAEVPAPLILAPAVPGEPVGQDAAVPAEDSARPPVPALRRPLVVSVQRADVAKLALTDLDLRPCRFVGAHHLDQLTVNSDDAFHRAPARLGHGRQVLAEECAWRHQRSRWAARRWPVIPASAFAEQPTADPGELVGVYRQLRKGREDAKNEPGAADLYYGECEMRRHAADTPWAEKAILTAYWLLSGYGLRAGRALLTLLAVVAVTVGLLVLYGLPEIPAQAAGRLQGRIAGGQTVTVQLAPAESTSVPTSRIADRWSWQRFEKATRIALNAVVFRSAEQQLTTPGRYIEMTARFLGPVLLALAILAIRNRVKR